MMGGPSIWLFRALPFRQAKVENITPLPQSIHFAASWVDKCPQGKGQHSGQDGVGRNKLLGSRLPFLEQFIHSI